MKTLSLNRLRWLRREVVRATKPQPGRLQLGLRLGGRVLQPRKLGRQGLFCVLHIFDRQIAPGECALDPLPLLSALLGTHACLEQLEPGLALPSFGLFLDNTTIQIWNAQPNGALPGAEVITFIDVDLGNETGDRRA